MKLHPVYIIGSFIQCLSVLAYSQPSLMSSQVINGQTIYRDIKQPNLFYHLPPDFKIVTDATGKPEFSMIEMRYTGTRATGDAGAIKFNNLLQFHVSIDPAVQRILNDIKTSLRKTYPAAELRTMPIRKFSSLLVFAGTSETSDDTILVQPGVAATEETSGVNNSYWNDRIITLRLNNNDAQIVETALRNRQSAVSFSYALYSVFSEMDASSFDVYGTRKMARQAKDYFAEAIKNAKDSALHVTLVKADAIYLDMDLVKWPSIIQKVDINEKLPAKYPLFDVYCYDFNNELRPDLYAKKIEIKATSVNGSEVLTSFLFKSNQPDLYVKSIRFPFAVRFDKPFYYRITEINKDGEPEMTEWKEKKEWSEILDITSPAAKQIIKPADENQ